MCPPSLSRSVAEHSGAPWFFLDCSSVFRKDRGKAERHVQVSTDHNEIRMNTIPHPVHRACKADDRWRIRPGRLLYVDVGMWLLSLSTAPIRLPLPLTDWNIICVSELAGKAALSCRTRLSVFLPSSHAAFGPIVTCCCERSSSP